jgi:hypothetical protein
MTQELGLVNVIGELSFDTPVGSEELAKLECSDASCFVSYRARLVRLFLARNCKRAVLLFHAPDAESVRLALRAMEIPFDRIWACAQMCDSAEHGADQAS